MNTTKHVLITEPGHALGSALCALYEGQGWSVIRPPEGLALSDEACAAFVAGIPSPDLLVVCPRAIARLDLMTASRADVEASLDANVLRSFLFVRHVGLRWTEEMREGAAFVFIGSVHDQKPQGTDFMFSCAMGALQMLHAETALHYGSIGMHSVLIELGPLAEEVPLLVGEQSTLYREPQLRIPRAELVDPGELWQLLEAARLSPVLNGSEIRADAGFTQSYNFMPRRRQRAGLRDKREQAEERN